MYKSVDIADVIGSVINEDTRKASFPLKKISEVLQKVAEADRYIRIEGSRSALMRVVALGENSVTIKDEVISLKGGNDVRLRFVNSFFSLDSSVQLLLSSKVQEEFPHEK